MFCSQCGQKNDGDAAFCGGCGSKLGGAAPAAPPAAPVHQQAAPADTAGPAPSVSFGGAISTCFSKFADGTGRASPSEYWWFTLFTFIASALTLGLSGLITFIPSFAVTVRRLHDTGRSGWAWLWCFTIIGAIPVLIWLIEDGKPGPNKYNT